MQLLKALQYIQTDQIQSVSDKTLNNI